MNNRNNTAGGDERGWGREKSRGGEGIGRNGRAGRAHGRTENWGRKRVCVRIVAEREGATARAGGRVRVEPRSHRGARQQLPRIKSAKQVARAAPPCVAVWVRVRWRGSEWGGGKGKRSGYYASKERGGVGMGKRTERMQRAIAMSDMQRARCKCVWVGDECDIVVLRRGRSTANSPCTGAKPPPT